MTFLADAAPVDPTGVATTLATNAGPQVVNAVVGILPVLIPTMLALWGIQLVAKKFGFLKKAKV